MNMALIRQGNIQIAAIPTETGRLSSKSQMSRWFLIILNSPYIEDTIKFSGMPLETLVQTLLIEQVRLILLKFQQKPRPEVQS
jgi:hypothetical protein